MNVIELSLKEVVTRTPHHCVWCGEKITPGELAVNRALIFDGFQSQYWHLECFDAMPCADVDDDWGFMEGEYKRGTQEPKNDTPREIA